MVREILRAPVVKKFQKAYNQPPPPPRNDTIPQNTQQFYTTKANPLLIPLFSPPSDYLFIIIFKQIKKVSLITSNNPLLQQYSNLNLEIS
jgi:hypothetical protein